MGASKVPGVMSVPCPICRSAAGRPCKNKRGYLTHLAHTERETAWLVQAKAELAALS